MRNLKRIFTNENGFSLVQVMISAALMAVVASGFSSMILNQSRESKAASEVLGVLDLQKTLIATLADGSICTDLTTKPTAKFFNAKALSQGPQKISFNSIPLAVGSGSPNLVAVNQLASSYSNSLMVKSIDLQISSGSAGQYSANWIVQFFGDRTVRQMKPITIGTTIQADDSIKSKALITSCQQSASSAVASIEAVNIVNVGNCSTVMASLNARTGNTLGHKSIGNSQYWIANDGSWSMEVYRGDCSPITNSPERGVAKIARDKQGKPVKGYFTSNYP